MREKFLFNLGMKKAILDPIPKQYHCPKTVNVKPIISKRNENELHCKNYQGGRHYVPAHYNMHCCL